MHINIPQIYSLLSQYGYIILFPIEVIEGPIVTVLSGLLVSLGIFNFFISYFVVLAGDLTGDVIYYCLGKWWLRNFARKKFGKLEKVFVKHKGKILFFGKLASIIGPAAMIVAGAIEIPFGEFMYINLLSSLFKSVLLISVGYYLGGALIRMGSNSNKLITLASLAAAIVFISLYFLLVRFSNRYITRLEKD